MSSLSRLFRRNSRELLVLAVAVCVLLAQDQDEESLEVMSAFFEVVGDVLALFALQPDLCKCLRLAESGQESGESHAFP